MTDSLDKLLRYFKYCCSRALGMHDTSPQPRDTGSPIMQDMLPQAHAGYCAEYMPIAQHLSHARTFGCLIVVHRAEVLAQAHINTFALP